MAAVRGVDAVKRPKQCFDLCEVWWDDATDLESGWSDKVEELKPALALSVGFLVKETKDHIVLALDTDADGQHNGRSQIPRGMVKKIKVLRKKDSDAN
jgi:hypothetical protein